MPRPIHFEIHAGNPQRAIDFYTTLFGWKFTQWGTEPYWLITTGDASEPGIDGGLLPRRGAGRPRWRRSTRSSARSASTDLDATVAKLTAAGGSSRAAEDADADGRLARLRQGHAKATSSA